MIKYPEPGDTAIIRNRDGVETECIILHVVAKIARPAIVVSRPAVEGKEYREGQRWIHTTIPANNYRLKGE